MTAPFNWCDSMGVWWWGHLALGAYGRLPYVSSNIWDRCDVDKTRK
jgi:hypothetical protein